MGYSSTAKGYRVFNLEIENLQVSRNVKFDDSAFWNWDNNEAEFVEIIQQRNSVDHDQVEIEESSDSDSEIPVRGTRLLTDIYDRCNVAMMEPSNYIEASKSN